VEIPENYPTEKPLITFYGVIPWHPNIANGNGNICIDMLNHWKSSDSVINGKIVFGVNKNCFLIYF